MELTKRRFLAGSLSSLAASSAFGQSFPSKTITIVVPFAPGGTTDILARVVGQELSNRLGTTVVENKTGGAGVVGWVSVAKGQPDGHTVLTTEMSLAIAPSLNPNLPFDPRKDLTQVIIAASVPHVLVVNPQVPAKTLQEFIAYSKANPGKLFYGSGGIGTNTHLGFELLKSQTGVDVGHVPYRGAGAVVKDVIAGHVQALVGAVPTVLEYVRSGQLRPLMLTALERSKVLPDVPSAKDVGLPQMDVSFWVGFAVPAATPAPIVERLHAAILGCVKAPAVSAKFVELGFDPVGNSVAEAGDFMRSEIDRWAGVIKSANIKAN
ncbi:Bug family tripartite tricarboxylate transporter substrate binding protein [Rhodoplanes sp. Z2-YC6860]|uniref:Bug family tripartite tricarboxylate transporter substrate binding protein n=1 Tax=Rhodoplanes sp. Z2-YC6860 TaxID=674703 RepID=UPI00078D1328|nr:tripartite tricarboxylate transporter substrate binding protein [Rhodoplanes sp. Z2-YC6860]AMN40991.1 TTT family tricarboxylate transporter, receptor protein [Rhodoplanes sp. Z2-YC6860]